VNKEEALRKIIRESIIDEGFIDWIRSKWKGDSGNLESAQRELKQIYSSIDPLRKDFPRATKRIRENIRRAILDLEHINTLMSKGIDEKSFLDGDL